jgi:hypothetical protein
MVPWTTERRASQPRDQCDDAGVQAAGRKHSAGNRQYAKCSKHCKPVRPHDVLPAVCRRVIETSVTDRQATRYILQTLTADGKKKQTETGQRNQCRHAANYFATNAAFDTHRAESFGDKMPFSSHTVDAKQPPKWEARGGVGAAACDGALGLHAHLPGAWMKSRAAPRTERATSIAAIAGEPARQSEQAQEA